MCVCVRDTHTQSWSRWFSSKQHKAPAASVAFLLPPIISSHQMNKFTILPFSGTKFKFVEFFRCATIDCKIQMGRLRISLNWWAVCPLVSCNALGILINSNIPFLHSIACVFFECACCLSLINSVATLTYPGHNCCWCGFNSFFVCPCRSAYFAIQIYHDAKGAPF